MKTEPAAAQWLCEHAQVTFEELVELSGLPPELLRELVDYGALEPSGSAEAQWSFTADCVVSVRTVGRLREDFDLDATALPLALALVERIHDLEAQLRELQSQLPHLRVKG
jgi:chaperone modulatory protein CbpM